MEDIYVIDVSEKLFEKICGGKCLYYIFLNDKDRLKYKAGNFLTFKSGESEQKVVIVDMLYFSNIKELLDMVGKEKCGYTGSQNPDKIEDIYYKVFNLRKMDEYALMLMEAGQIFYLNKDFGRANICINMAEAIKNGEMRFLKDVLRRSVLQHLANVAAEEENVVDNRFAFKNDFLDPNISKEEAFNLLQKLETKWQRLANCE